MRPRNVKLPDGLPEEIKALGSPIASFETGIVLYLYFAGVMFLLGAAFIGLTILGIAAPEMGAGAGVCCAILGTISLRNCWRKPKLRVFVCPQEMAYLATGIMEIVYWNDIYRILRLDEADNTSSNFIVDGVYQVILVRRDGRQFQFNESLSRLREFYKLVKEHTLPHMVPSAMNAYESGATIGFGEVSISRERIHNGPDTLAWGRFESAKSVKGHLIVRETDQKKPFCRVPISQVPNIHVLLALVERVAPIAPH